MPIAAARSHESRAQAFAAIAAAAGLDIDASAPDSARPAPSAMPPYMTEAWYCCAEPGPEQLETL